MSMFYIYQQCPPGSFSYIIRPGDNLYQIARRFRTTVPAIISANPLVNPNNLVIGQIICVPQQAIFPPCPERNFYRIRRGDTLNSVARFYNVSLDDLIEANPGIAPNRLMVGQIICIPLATPPVRCPGNTRAYVIKAGDTFYSIATRFNTTVERIRSLNPNVNPNALLIGQTICLPM